MKIIQIAYNEIEGGIRTYVSNLLRSFSTLGLDVTLIGFHPKSNLNTYSYVPLTSKQNNRYIYLFNLFLKAPFLKLPPNAIICTHRPDDMFPFILFYKKNPKVCTLHGNLLENIRIKHNKIISKLYEIVEAFALKHLLRDNCVIITVDNTTKKYYEKKYPWIENKIMIIPIGINPKEFRPLSKLAVRKRYGFTQNDKIIMYVGRLEKEKDLDFLISAFAKIKKMEPHAKLILIGDGRERENLEMLVDKFNMTDTIEFMGAAEHKMIPEILNCADVFALCSHYEASPTVVKEALACGVPVVSMNVGDVSTIINKKVGALVRKNQKEFATAILDILDRNPNKLRENCLNMSKKFGFEKIAKKTIEVYKKLRVE